MASDADAAPLLSWSASTRPAASMQRPFRELFQEYAPGIWRFLRHMLGTSAAADEATQETFVRAHAAFASKTTVEHTFPWLLGIARNVAREHLRARSRVIPMESPQKEEEPTIAPDPEALLAGRETSEALRRAMEQLSEERRTVLVLRVVHDLSYEELAATLDWPVVRVRNELHRARTQLRAALIQHLDASENRHE